MARSCATACRFRRIAAAVGTPLYVYSAATIASRYRAIDEAFAGYPHALHYALKANSTLAIARLLRGLGSAADANSGGEIDVALRAGFIPPQIVFTGVGKTPAELAQAIELGVKTINAESAGELERIDAIARDAADARARRAPRQPGHRRAEPSAHLDRAEDQQVRHRRSTTCARSARATPRRGRARARRPAHPRRLADHGSRRRCAAPRGARRRSRASCATTASRSSTSISAAASASPTTAAPVPTAHGLRGGAAARRQGLRPARSSSSRAAHRRRPPACC